MASPPPKAHPPLPQPPPPPVHPLLRPLWLLGPTCPDRNPILSLPPTPYASKPSDTPARRGDCRLPPRAISAQRRSAATRPGRSLYTWRYRPRPPFLPSGSARSTAERPPVSGAASSAADARQKAARGG
jgi:hypothetical protein